MYAGEFLTSSNGDYILMFLADGNLVLFDQDENVIWQSDTADAGATHVRMEEDGNLKILDGASQTIWESQTSGEYGWCGVSDSGAFIIYDQYSQVVISWPS